MSVKRGCKSPRTTRSTSCEVHVKNKTFSFLFQLADTSAAGTCAERTPLGSDSPTWPNPSHRRIIKHESVENRTVSHQLGDSKEDVGVRKGDGRSAAREKQVGGRERRSGFIKINVQLLLRPVPSIMSCKKRGSLWWGGGTTWVDPSFLKSSFTVMTQSPEGKKWQTSWRRLPQFLS